ncbi:DUF397 domain-containing protein [Nocardia asiatica]|uniref:DUF397 domain-containing protein n=1 Tax=Nocardia asiatica TaxID=209252 RepID=UPI0024544D16|nr:DUF397 domain-containing protein [Nocardia asiatica]
MSTNEPVPVGWSDWEKSPFSDHGNACVEVRFGSEEVQIRDSKYRGDEALRPIISIPVDLWGQFLAIVSEEVIDNGDLLGIPTIQHNDFTGETSLRDAAETTLTYTAVEWDAFIGAIRAGRLHQATI